MSAEQGERCQLCGSLVEVVSSDEGTLSYRPASAEQGDVETLRNLLLSSSATVPRSVREREGLAAVDRLAAALERAERERDHWKLEARGLASEQRVAEKAEQERDTYKQDYLTRHERWRDTEARAEKAERALAEIEISEPDWAKGVDENCETLRSIAQAALHPSEDTSDES